MNDNGLFKCQSGERRNPLALNIVAGRRAAALDISKLIVRSVDDQLAVSLAQVTALGRARTARRCALQ